MTVKPGFLPKVRRALLVKERYMRTTLRQTESTRGTGRTGTNDHDIKLLMQGDRVSPSSSAAQHTDLANRTGHNVVRLATGLLRGQCHKCLRASGVGLGVSMGQDQTGIE